MPVYGTQHLRFPSIDSFVNLMMGESDAKRKRTMELEHQRQLMNLPLPPTKEDKETTALALWPGDDWSDDVWRFASRTGIVELKRSGCADICYYTNQPLYREKYGITLNDYVEDPDYFGIKPFRPSDSICNILAVPAMLKFMAEYRKDGGTVAKFYGLLLRPEYIHNTFLIRGMDAKVPAMHDLLSKNSFDSCSKNIALIYDMKLYDFDITDGECDMIQSIVRNSFQADVFCDFTKQKEQVLRTRIAEEKQERNYAEFFQKMFPNAKRVPNDVRFRIDSAVRKLSDKMPAGFIQMSYGLGKHAEPVPKAEIGNYFGIDPENFDGTVEKWEYALMRDRETSRILSRP